jgi:DNA-binding response OmpR family regulator
MRILVVDDEAAVADAIAESVRAQGHEAFIAHDSPSAVAVLAEVVPDAVFLDLVMPGAGGIELLERIRQTHKTLPVIIVTGRATDAMLGEARRLGIAGVLEKPFTLTHLDWMLTARVLTEAPEGDEEN